LLGGISAVGALTLGAACETVDAQEVAAYLAELNDLRDSTAGDDALLGEQFNALIASGSRDAGAYLAIYQELRTSNAAVLARLEQIQPPTGLERHHEDFVEGLRDLVTALDQVIMMVEEGNVIEANRLFQRSVTKSQAKQTGAMLQIRRVARSARVRV
jgi:soluble cytochrome b562